MAAEVGAERCRSEDRSNSSPAARKPVRRPPTSLRDELTKWIRLGASRLDRRRGSRLHRVVSCRARRSTLRGHLALGSDTSRRQRTRPASIAVPSSASRPSLSPPSTTPTRRRRATEFGHAVRRRRTSVLDRRNHCPRRRDCPRRRTAANASIPLPSTLRSSPPSKTRRSVNPSPLSLDTFAAVLMLRPFDDLLLESNRGSPVRWCPRTQLDTLVSAADIYVDPRYGRWDPYSVRSSRLTRDGSPTPRVGTVTIVGLGPGGPQYVTQQTLDAILGSHAPIHQHHAAPIGVARRSGDVVRRRLRSGRHVRRRLRRDRRTARRRGRRARRGPLRRARARRSCSSAPCGTCATTAGRVRRAAGAVVPRRRLRPARHRPGRSRGATRRRARVRHRRRRRSRGPLLVAHTHADWVLSDIKLAVEAAPATSRW